MFLPACWSRISGVFFFMVWWSECRSVSILSIRPHEIDWLTKELNKSFVLDLRGTVDDWQPLRARLPRLSLFCP